ncbi:MAG: hypothetical protein R6T90_00675 [Dissulfuribacterales bacterium]
MGDEVSAERISLGFIGVAINSFHILATDDKSDTEDRLKHFSPGNLPVEKIIIAFGEASFPVEKSSTGNDFLLRLPLTSAFLVCGQ